MNQRTILFLGLVCYLCSEMSWKQIFSILGLFVGGFLYLIYHGQEKLLYLNEGVGPKKPSENPPPYQHPGQMKLEYTNLYLTTEDNLKLHCWWIPQPNSEQCPTIVFFQENAGNMGFRLPNIYHMFDTLKVNIFMLSYRGYGESEGVPTEEGLKIDAVTTIEYVYDNWEKLKLDRNRIYLFGRSLGGAVAIYVASRYGDRVAGVILENTFTSINDMVKKVFPFLDFDIVKRYMLRLEWKTIDLIAHISCPIMFLASGKDEIVPSEQMVVLHQSANKTRFKSWHSIPEATHNDAWLAGSDTYWKAIRTFLQDCEKINQENSTCDTKVENREKEE